MSDTSERKLSEHKALWDELAQKNDRYVVRSVDHEQPDDEYEASGRDNVQQFIELDSALKQRLGPLSDLVILEIGCGSGRMTKTLAKKFRHVVALDISATMLEKAREFVASDNVTFVESTGSSVPLLPETVDLAFSYIVYQHFPSKHAVEESFRGVWRALKPGGMFKVQIRGLQHPNPKHWSWGVHFTPDEATALSREAGFEMQSSTGEGQRSHWLLLQKLKRG